ncbi:MAG TPA: type II and III secretion system protein family protein [Stellaceae bacterium]|nr:type II and III secretion system protein family protein [Stellaceae bacterium]
MFPLPRYGLVAAVMWLGLTAAAMAAEPQPSGAPADPPAAGAAVQIPANGPAIRLEIGRGTLIRLPRPASTVFIASPDIADVQVKSPTLVYVSAKSPGETVIYAVDADDRVMLNAPVRVDLDLSQLRQSLRQLVPGAPISVSEVDSSLVLSGAVASAGQAEKARTLANAVTGTVKGEQVINKLTVATPNQVDLHVRIAEVDRNILKQIGINWDKPNGNITFSTNNPVSGVNFLTGKFLPGAEQISTMIDALATEGFVTDLADPNLTAVSGQTASFLAGGEIPYEVAQPGSVGSATLYTIQFEQYGVQLAFTPTIIDADHLSLRVRPEVSTLDYAHAVTVNGVIEPGFIVRQAETTVELASGQSFALAGLLQHDTEQDISEVPWLGDIPILGALFRSNKFQNDETELVVIVTPYLVRPPTTALATPLNGWVAPHDAQQVLFGDTWQQSLPAPARGPLDSGGAGLIGPAGFRLD